MYKEIKTIIKKILKNNNQQEYEKFLTLKTMWNRKINQTTAKNATIVDYTNKTLTIQTKNPSWKNELSFMKTEIKKNFLHQQHQLK